MFQSLPSTRAIPLWLELLKATIGPLIAAIVFIIGLMLRDRIERRHLIEKDRVDRRNEAQSWFEQTYITDAVDLLIAHLAAIEKAFQDVNRLTLKRPITPLSPHVFRRLNTLG